MTHTPELINHRLIFHLPDREGRWGGKETNRMIRCECIRGDIAKEIQIQWDTYRTGCAGLNPAAYRAVVESLTNMIGDSEHLAFPEEDKVTAERRGGIVKKARRALALATGGQA